LESACEKEERSAFGQKAREPASHGGCDRKWTSGGREEKEQGPKPRGKSKPPGILETGEVHAEEGNFFEQHKEETSQGGGREKKPVRTLGGKIVTAESLKGRSHYKGEGLTMMPHNEMSGGGSMGKLRGRVTALKRKVRFWVGGGGDLVKNQAAVPNQTQKKCGLFRAQSTRR